MTFTIISICHPSRNDVTWLGIFWSL